MNCSTTGKHSTGKHFDFKLRFGLGAVLFLCSSVNALAQGVFLDPTLHNAVRQELISIGADPGTEVDVDEMIGVGFTSFTNNAGDEDWCVLIVPSAEFHPRIELTDLGPVPTPSSTCSTMTQQH